MLGGFLNVEGVDLQLRGKNPTVMPVDKLGIPTYDELVLVANSDDSLDSESQNIRALPRRAAARHRGGGRRPGRRDQGRSSTPGKGLDPKTTAAEMKRPSPSSRRRARQPYGYMDPNQWTSSPTSSPTTA